MRFRTRGFPDVDEGSLQPLLEESADLHADSMAATNESLAEMVELGHERRATGDLDAEETAAFATERDRNLAGAFGGKILAAAGVGTAFAALTASKAFADSPTDIQILQTAASIENLAVATYTVALTLPFIGGADANGVVKAFSTMTMQQHQQHAQAFNAAISQLGGKHQTNPDPALLQVVDQAKPGLTGPGPVVALATRARAGRGGDLRGQRRRVVRCQRQEGDGQHHGRRGPARGHPARRAGPGSRQRRGRHRAAAARGHLAGRSRLRRLPRRVLPDQPGPPRHGGSTLMTNNDPNHKPGELGISDAELAAMTKDLDQLYNDVSLPALRTSVDEWVETNHGRRGASAKGRTSRRTFILGTGAAAVGGIVLAACSSNSSSSSTATATGAGSSPASLTGDLKVAALAASLENLGVFAYNAGIQAATAGKLGTVPPAVVTFAQTAMSQHTQHAAAWNSVLTGAGKAKVTETDPALTPTVQQMFSPGDRRGRTGQPRPHHREHRGTDLPGGDQRTVLDEGHPSGCQHPPGGDAARGDPVLRARPVPGPQRLQPGRQGPAAERPGLSLSRERNLTASCEPRVGLDPGRGPGIGAVRAPAGTKACAAKSKMVPGDEDQT